MIDAKIVLLETSSCNIPDSYRDDDGTISVPITVNVDLNIKKQQLSNFSKLVSDYTNSFTQEVNNEDRYKLQNVHHIRKANKARYRGYLIAGGIKTLDGFVIVSKTEERPSNGEVRYTFQIIGTHQSWKESSGNVKVCELVTEPNIMTWSKQNILDLWQNNQKYTDGGSTIYPLFANFGKYLANIPTGLEDSSTSNRDFTVSVQDIRLLNYLVPIIKKGFCSIGYEVQSRFLDSGFARSQAGYHMAEDYAKRSITQYNHLFRAKGTDGGDQVAENFSNQDLSPRIIRIDDDSTDPCFDRGGGYITPNAVTNFENCFVNNTRGTVRYRFHYNVFLRRTFGGGNPTGVPPVKFFLDAVYGDASDQNSQFQLPITSEVGFGARFEGYFDMNVPPNYYVQLGFFVTDRENENQFASGYWQEAEWYNERLSEVFLEGDEIDINKTIDPDLTLNDIMFDAAVLYNLRFRTSESNKLVEMEPDPSTYEVYEIALEEFIRLQGFEGREIDQNGYIDLTKDINLLEFIEKDTREQKVPESYLFAFKNHTDKYELYDEYTDEEPPLSKLIIQENGTANQVKVRLKLYEPTLNDFDQQLTSGNASTPYIPFMWGNQRKDSGELPEPSNKIGFRMLCVLGWVKQHESMEAEPATWSFEDEEFDHLPTVFQFDPHYYSPFDIAGGSAPRKTSLNNVFGNSEVDKDLVDTLFKGTIKQELEEIDHTFKIQMTNLTIACYRAGMLMRILYDNTDYERFNGFYRILEIGSSINSKTDATLRAKYISSEEDCIHDIVPDEPACDPLPTMKSALLWIDAQDINGDGSATTDGSQILTWKDKSDQANHLIQIGNESVPVKFTNMGKDIVEFTSDQLQTTNQIIPFGGTSYWMTILVMRTRLTSGDGYVYGFTEETVDGNVYNDGLQVPDDQERLSWEFRASNGNTQSVTEPWQGNTSDYYIWVIRHARWNAQVPTQPLFRQNGVDIGTATSNSNLSGTDSPLILGRRYQGSRWQHMNVAEMMIFNRIVSTEELTCIEEHLSEKWGIPLG